MIIWINGAFGSGKTQSAFELNRRLENSFVYDPEKMGFFITKNLPPSLKDKDDFQDYEAWRDLNFSYIKYIAERYDGTLIIPMTIVDPKYFEEIVGSLRNHGLVVKHYALMASKETIHKRLKSRGTSNTSWGAVQTDRCLKGLSNDIFESHIDTENMSIYDVVEKIASLSELTLLPDNTSRFKKKINRIKTQMKQLRIFS